MSDEGRATRETGAGSTAEPVNSGSQLPELQSALSTQHWPCGEHSALAVRRALSTLSLLYFGSSEFAVPILRRLAGTEHEVKAVYTQPDRPAGRGLRIRSSPVAVAARELGLPLEQPERLRGDAVEGIRAYAPDIVVLAAYGLIVPRAALEIPRWSWLNVHPSLLPKYRGASPVAAPILAGEVETGVTIFLMTPGLDDGPILTQSRTEIGPAETTGELTHRLAELGAAMLPETIQGRIDGSIESREQEHSAATYAPKLSREQAVLNWSLPAPQLARHVRAYNPWPVAHTYWNGQLLRILQAHPVGVDSSDPPGTVSVHAPSHFPLVACGAGALVLDELQLSGKNRTDGSSFLAGRRDLVGARLG